MDEQDHGIIVRVRPLTESSLIVHWITQKRGRVAVVAKGARKPKSSFQGRLDLYCEGSFSYVRSRRSSLHTLREVAISQHHTKAAANLLGLRILAYSTQLIEWTVEEDTPAGELFTSFDRLVKSLETGRHGLIPLLAFEADLLEMLGALGEEPSVERVRAAGLAEALPIEDLRRAASKLGFWLSTELGKTPPARMGLLKDLRPPGTEPKP